MPSQTPFKLTTPLPPKALWFQAMTHSGGLSTLEEMQLTLLSETADLEPEKLLGQPLDLAVLMRDGSPRHFCGLVTRFGLGRHQGKYHGYTATVRPWLWFLTRTADCRIFQEMTVPDIVEAVFKDHGAIANYKLKLVRSYRQRVYTVQYRETDFNFVARLMEDEGIYWYVQHSEGQHTLMIVDAPSAHTPMPGNATLPFFDNEGQAPPDTEVVSQWDWNRSVKPGKTVLTSYDFERPSTTLTVKQALQRSYRLDSEELFDYQGDYTQKGDGQQQADDRLDEQQCRYEQASGLCNAHALATGTVFELARHPHGTQNGKYLCTRAQVSARDQSGEAGSAAGELQCSFDAQPSDATYRPARNTPKPFVQGPQTAVVVGPAGEELFTDKFGRVKVQFHWDRYGKKNEKSSCWVRVSSPWAGKSFGFVQVPRIGQEVVVDFLEGDPDQPLITGRVYNAEQMPPWELPANATQSGVLSRSSKGGAYGNANALRFEDKKGAEQVWLHAEKNQDIEVENDETHWVGHDRSKTVDHDEKVLVKHDRAERVDNDETISVGRDRMVTIERNKFEKVVRNKTVNVLIDHEETVGGSMSVSVGKSLSEVVALNYSETVGAAMELTVGGALAISVGGVLAESVGGAKAETIGGTKTENIGAGKSLQVGTNLTETVGGAFSFTAAKDHTEKAGGTRRQEVAKEFSVQAKKFVVTADDEISFKTGSAEIVLKKNGDITIKGNKITVKGSSDVVIKGSKIQEN